MKKIGFLLFFLPTGLWANQLLERDACQNNVCFWVANTKVQQRLKIVLQFSPQKDCGQLIEPAQEEEVKLQDQYLFSFNSKALYTLTSRQEVHGLYLKINDDEHCLPIHCHPSEESCHFERPFETKLVF